MSARAGGSPARGLAPRATELRRLRRPASSMVTVLALVVGLTGLVAAAEGESPTRAWLDAPLPGSVLPLSTIEVTAHAAHPSGIVRVELLADGVVVDAIDSGDILSGFLLASLSWSPPTEGPYTLTVRAKSTAAGWSDPAGAGITIDQDLVVPSSRPGATATPRPSEGPSPSAGRSAEPTGSGVPTGSPGASAGPTPAATPTAGASPSSGPTTPPTAAPTPSPTALPTSSPRPTPVPTPAPTPCTPIAPSLVAPADGDEIRDSAQNPPTLLWEYLEIPTCLPSSFRVQVSTSRDFSTILYNAVVPSTSWEWTPPDALADCQTYAWRVFPRRSDGTNGPSSAVWTFSLFVGRCL